MADQEVNGSYNYPTSILTETLPSKAALILPNGLNQSQQVNDKLTSWFKNYNNTMIGYNNQLKKVLEEGSHLINEDNKPALGSFYKYWNCLLTSLQLEVETNDLLIKNFATDIISPLGKLTDDVKFSELLINSQELTEIVDDISQKKSNSEIQWNYKAPQIFQNFENFKSEEIQLLFQAVLNYFQIYNAKLSKNLQNNENSSNYVVSNFRLDGEMNQYLNYVMKTEFKSVNPYGTQMQQQQLAQRQAGKKKSQPLPPPPIQTPRSEKRQSKLKLKVGSIFGRKKKPSRVGTSESIAENESLHSIGSRPTADELMVSSQRVTSRRRSDVSSKLYGNPIQEENKVQNPGFYTKPPQKDIPESNLNNNSTFNSQQQQPMQSFQALEPTQKENHAPPPPVNYQQNSYDHPESSSAQNYNNQQLPPPPSEKSNFTPGVVGGAVAGGLAATAGVVGIKALSDASNYHENQGANQNTLQQQQSTSSASDPFGANGDHFNSGSNAAVNETNGEVSNQQQGRNLAVPETGSGINNVDNQQPTTPQEQSHTFNNVDETPNFTKFNESESSDNEGEYDALPAAANNRLSMLQRHDITDDEPLPPSQFDSTVGNRHLDPPRLSSEQYSFEVGDENRVNAKDELPEPDLDFSPVKPQVQKQIPIPVASGSKPPPPPSRKVMQHAPASPVRQRSDVNSQMFHNLPQARDSVIAPRRDLASMGTIPAGGLVAQDTGNSLMRQDLFKHFDNANYVSSTGLNSSIAEVINATFKDGKVTKSQIVGEVAFNYKLSEQDNLAPTEPILLQVPNKFNKLIVNRDIMEDLGDNLFRLSPLSITSKTLGGLKYLVNLPESQTPIIIQQIWKYEEHQASLMINLKLNSNIQTRVAIENLVVTVALNPNVVSASASSKPQGSFNKEKSRITWRYNQPLVLGGNGPSEEKLIARFMTNGKGSEHESGVQIKFQIHDSPLRNTMILDYNKQQEVPSVTSLISGNYSGHE